MKYLISVLLLSACVLLGCPHNISSAPLSGSAATSLNQKPEKAPIATDPSESATDELEAEFLDEDIDFLEEENEELVLRVPDPIAPWNRVMFHFNDKFYFWVLKPVAKGYRALVPLPVRTCVENFFYNLATPIRLVNCILQRKGRAADAEFVRFLLNTTVGILGFGDPAKRYPELNPSPEDLGQTLGIYKIGNGFYIVWPFLGPSTLRDSVGMIGDLFLNPITYVQPTEASLGISGYKTVNETSFRIGDYESFKEAAIEPYEAFRDAYIQQREKKVKE